jgi:flagellar hook assembly protein FlgD
MVVHLQDGSKHILPVARISKITFKDSMTTSVASENANVVIKTFKLFQNYPNPFNPSTTIEYDIKTAGEVEIRIFNIVGQVVRKYSEKRYSAGRYKTVWDGRDQNGKLLASGVYIYQVKFESSKIAKSMLLLK